MSIEPDTDETIKYTLEKLTECIEAKNYRSAYRQVYYLLAVIYWTCMAQDRMRPQRQPWE